MAFITAAAAHRPRARIARIRSSPVALPHRRKPTPWRWTAPRGTCADACLYSCRLGFGDTTVITIVITIMNINIVTRRHRHNFTSQSPSPSEVHAITDPLSN
eukprot:819837-Pyramimonas_sp.AAC.1